jgi:hypothetical protein
MNNTIGNGTAVIQCEKCGKIIGVEYLMDDKTFVKGDCYCIECHNKEAREEQES